MKQIDNYDTIKVTYLLNSGFALEMGDCAMVFDYYRDEKNLVPAIIADKKEVYFFVSHVHYDHFNPQIAKFAGKVTRYFISYDVEHDLPPADKVVQMEEYTAYDDKDIHVRTYSSTDAGVCFYIEKHGWKIFHAGDFNWWHWKGDTPENIALARNGFKKQLRRMEGMQSDIAFFPVDSRLEEYLDLGAREFCAHTKVKNLITMHNAGSFVWKVPADFPHRDEMQSIRIPQKPGETYIITR